MKIKELNKQMIDLKRSQRFQQIPNILRQYNQIFGEITEYNGNYWSKFLFILWLFFGNIIVLLVYTTLFTQVNIILRLMMIYVNLTFIVMFHFVFSIASSLFSEVTNTYKIFHTLMSIHSKTKVKTTVYLSTNFKVIYKTPFLKVP